LVTETFVIMVHHIFFQIKKFHVLALENYGEI